MRSLPRVDAQVLFHLVLVQESLAADGAAHWLLSLV